MAKNEDTLNIGLTKKQYWNLLRATYMSDWMANAICDGDMKEDEGIKKIRNHVFSFAKNMGFGGYVGHEEDIGYYAELDLDDEPSVRALINRYDDHIFWEELSEILGERDFYRLYSEEAIKQMSDEERFVKLQECIIKYEKEFEERGVEKLELLKTLEDLEKGI